MKIKKYIVLFLLILALGAFFRFYLLTEIPPGLYPDEAMNGNNALETLSTGNFKIFYPENNGREGLFINLQMITLWAFGNEPWALRVVSALFGTLTILGVYLLSKELFETKTKESSIKIRPLSEFTGATRLKPSSWLSIQESTILDTKYLILNTHTVALLSSFFLATSYWHINFSRIGFRAILIPFFATFGMYFLLRGLRDPNIWDMVLAGVFIGLGFHSYIAFRFMSFMIAVPLVWYLRHWWIRRYFRGETSIVTSEVSPLKKINTSCIPCLIALFLFITFVVALPIGYYFLQNPQDFLGRGGQVSIFSSGSPLKEFIKSNLLTIAMPFVRGDCNWRHNLACKPELNPIVAVFFVLGLIYAVRSLFRTKFSLRSELSSEQSTFLLAWLFFMMFPATLTREGLPHALRSIGLIPPIMILAGYGAYIFLNKNLGWFELQKEKWPEKISQLKRVQQEIKLLFLLSLLLIPIVTYRDYFIRWAYNPNTYFAFSTDLWRLGKFLNSLPNDTKKYVITNLPGVDVRGIPMPAQTVMFATNTFQEEKRTQKNTYYIPSDFVPSLAWDKENKVVIAFLNGSDRLLINTLRQKFPELKIKTPGDFVIMQNY